MSPTTEPSVEWRSTPEGQAFVRFVELTRAKRGLTEEIRSIERELDMLEYQLRETLTTGLQRATIDGMTVYLKRQLYVRHREDATAAQLIQALKHNRMGHFVLETYNKTALTNHVRELEQEHKKEIDEGLIPSIANLLPFDVRAVLTVDHTYSIVGMETGKKG